MAQVLRHLTTTQQDPRLLVGLDTTDDAAVYRLTATEALIQTVDFFTPVVDDPYQFGQIAAANALSDVYAMGGRPLVALNIACFPTCLPVETLAQILQGGADKVREAGALVAGGHTVEDDVPKYGLSVTGVVHPQEVLTNAGAQVGDVLVLTKPLGTGIILTAAKAGLVPGELLAAAVASMVTLNRGAALAMGQVGVNGCTDVTGFGFLGHLAELASASKVAVEVFAQAVPVLPQVVELASMGILPGGAHRNRDYLEAVVTFDPDVDQAWQDVFFDPQTSGGLLISVRPDKAQQLLVALEQQGVVGARVVGRVVAGDEGKITVQRGLK